MRNSNHASKSVATANDFYRAFVELNRSNRRTVALRILRNQRLLADLYDHFLVQKALKENGRNIPWESYQALDKPIAP